MGLGMVYRWFICKFLWALLLSVAFLGGCTSTQKLVNSKWYEIETKHFRIVTNGNSEKVERLAVDLERLRVVAERHIGFIPDQQKLTVYALSDTLSFKGVSGREDVRMVVGLFRNTSHGSFALVNLAGNKYFPGNPARQILFHEYVHFLTYGRSSSNLPYWYSEGMAEVFSTISFREDEYELGMIPISRAITLDYSRELPLKTLLEAKNGSLNNKDREALYANGWMLAHWLIFDRQRAKALGRYLNSYNKGLAEARPLWEELGMTFEELESQYRSLPKSKFGYFRMPMPKVKEAEFNSAVTRLPKKNAILEIANFMAITGQEVAQLKSFIDYAEKQEIRSYELNSAMAVAELQAGNFPKAKGWLDSIPVEFHGERWFLEVQARIGLAEELSKFENINLNAVVDIRDKYVKLVNSQDDVPIYWYELAVVMQVLGYPREDYLEILEQAYLRAPRNVRIAWWYAHELYVSRDKEYFAQVASPLMVQLSNLERESRLTSMRREIEQIKGDRLSAKPVKEGLGEKLEKYQSMTGKKAVALALDFRGSFAVGLSEENVDQQVANDNALGLCEKYRKRYKVFGKCRLYAEGDQVVGTGAIEIRL
ncbi:hypothetical protein BTJ40_15960 [Microbulbifer sp. A4B17]|uniref:hypothetical protein n=1 Tax=Microbulbifer sp. A4B17 TaxID=359370 RepID=UPI000D52D115|nr:hypothetical protein [Microbulbifer sp. A4B17]AWF82207.1 hypothetical protein BTJ40_15960 [Microbulbifer sp. A4B17]